MGPHSLTRVWHSLALPTVGPGAKIEVQGSLTGSPQLIGQLVNVTAQEIKGLWPLCQDRQNEPIAVIAHVNLHLSQLFRCKVKFRDPGARCRDSLDNLSVDRGKVRTGTLPRLCAKGVCGRRLQRRTTGGADSELFDVEGHLCFQLTRLIWLRKQAMSFWLWRLLKGEYIFAAQLWRQ